MINRSLVVVKVRQPFIDWLSGLPDPEPADTTVANVNEDSHVYLLPEWDTPDEAQELLRQCFDIIFENELAGWWTVEDDWPTKRTFKLFQAWFEVEFHSCLIDLVEGPLDDDEV